MQGGAIRKILSRLNAVSRKLGAHQCAAVGYRLVHGRTSMGSTDDPKPDDTPRTHGIVLAYAVTSYLVMTSQNGVATPNGGGHVEMSRRSPRRRD